MAGNKTVIKNTIMLYGLSMAKILFPIITLPYLTRVLSVPTYGIVTYTRSIVSYLQLIMDFGFMLSATKDIVEAKRDGREFETIIGSVLIAQGMLIGISVIALIGIVLSIPMLKGYELYVLISYIPILLSTQLFDYVFRGIEKMEIITIRFVVMKGVSTLLTFLLVKNDSCIMLIPILDIVGSLAAAILVRLELKKLGIRIRFESISAGVIKLKESFVYFASNIATTAFGALNTMIIGICLSSSDVAYWSVCEQLIGGVQMMYNPLTSGIYPEMIKTRDYNYIRKLLRMFMPIIVAGCIFTFYVARIALFIVGGENYVGAAYLLRLLIPVLLFSFPGIVFGWPTLGAIGHAKDVTKTTVTAAIFQITGIGILIIIDKFNLITLAVLRCLTELVLMSSRYYFVRKFKREFTRK